MILFNFGNEEFAVNMGDKVAQLIFEKIKTPEIKEVNELEETGRGSKGYGSTGLSADELKLDQGIKTKISSSSQSSKSDQSEQKKAMNKPVQMKSKLSQMRQIISARQIQKLANDDNPVFSAIVRQTNETPQKWGN